jgi:O-methyltransferase
MSVKDANLNPNLRLQPISMGGKNYNIKDPAKFDIALKFLRESLFDNGATIFCSDNVITWNKNLSFLREDRFLAKLNDPTREDGEKSTIWRLYILLYFAKLSLNLDGDFMECGTYRGTTVEDVLKECNLKKYGKKYWLYDLFEWKEGDEHTHLSHHDNPDMHKNVLLRFSEQSNVSIIKGSVPESFSQGFPNSVAFCHIDMNHPAAESATLEAVLPILVDRGCIIFDDYGWWHYSAQKIALDKVATLLGQEILELPTGQGLLIKR